VWKIKVPPRIHVFLWLLAKGKVLTRDNLDKCRHVDKTCLFCAEAETINHIFFECCVVKLMWEMMSEVTGFPAIADFESLAKCWLNREKLMCLNVTSAAVIWSIWKTRNNMCFQGLCWSKVEMIFSTCARLIRNWMILSKLEERTVLESWAQAMEGRCARPPRLMGCSQAVASPCESDV
jgi:hypothetical protein